MRNILFTPHAWEDYTHWQTQDKCSLKRINKLLEAIQCMPFEGIGKPEPLKENLTGYWSRRITDEQRLVYKAGNDTVIVVSARFHYG